MAANAATTSTTTAAATRMARSPLTAAASSWRRAVDTGSRDTLPPVRVHDARHTAATLLLEQGIGIRVVQQILGHSQLSQTERYTHVTTALSQDAADRMSEALCG